MERIRISSIGLSEWESVFLQTTVSMASGVDIATWRFEQDPERADVLLVAAEGTRGRQLLEEQRAASDGKLPIIVSYTDLGSSESGGGSRGLVRPVSYSGLISLLRDIETEIRRPAVTLPTLEASSKPPPAEPKPPPAGQKAPQAEQRADPHSARPDHQPLSPAGLEFSDRVRPARRFVQETRVLGPIRHALLRGRPAELSHPAFPSVMVFPEQNLYLSPGRPTAIPKMFRASALEFSLRELPGLRPADVAGSRPARPLWALIYSAALFGSEGRLLANASPYDRLRLLVAPDFAVVPHAAEHRLLARSMLESAATLSEIASTSGIEVGTVIEFCNACESIGLVERLVAADPGDRRETGPKQDGAPQLLDKVRELFRLH